MKEANRERKNDIQEINQVVLNEEQRAARHLIQNNQIVIITGRAGSGKTLVALISAYMI